MLCVGERLGGRPQDALPDGDGRRAGRLADGRQAVGGWACTVGRGRLAGGGAAVADGAGG